MHRTVIALITGFAMTTATLGAAPVKARDRGDPVAVALLALLAAAVAKQNRQTSPEQRAPDQRDQVPSIASHQDREQLASRGPQKGDHAAGYR